MCYKFAFLKFVDTQKSLEEVSQHFLFLFWMVVKKYLLRL
jgi:hypothetical protein